ncbi:hypothetical protein SO802_026835 [Lithocarpus litseifolius]|uniref:RNase H type-1 domain-containing protein n=1 Tax=Lithocarpus litseifolius TaxID=425828 RepID=A0AAW2C0N5_9ROSI
MNRFVQELDGSEQSEAEMRKLKEDLDRWIHGQKLAAVFQGLGEQREGKWHNGNVAGVGIAICDSQDNLILEARKNVEAIVNGVVSGEVAELQALIEALNKALTLNLKSVTFFCDDYNW